ncbi:hypothetical protein D3C87_1864760 [compost metagenome]
MHRRHQDYPGNDGGVFNGVPVPVATEVERFISPVSAHQNTHTQNQRREQRPRQCWTDPFVNALGPKTCNRKRERNERAREAEEQGRRVDYHPVVLQQWIEAVTVFRDEIRVHFVDRQVGHYLFQ